MLLINFFLKITLVKDKMAKFANETETVEEESNPPYKITVSFTGYQHLDLVAHNETDMYNQMNKLSKKLKTLGLELEYDDPTVDWLGGQSPPDKFFEEPKETPPEKKISPDEKTEVVVSFDGKIDLETIKEEINHGLDGSELSYSIESFEDILLDFECNGGFGGWLFQNNKGV